MMPRRSHEGAGVASDTLPQVLGYLVLGKEPRAFGVRLAGRETPGTGMFRERRRQAHRLSDGLLAQHPPLLLQTAAHFDEHVLA